MADPSRGDGGSNDDWPSIGWKVGLRELPAIWSFLFDPSIDATTWRAEQALRPVIVTRKVRGENRSRHGADSQQILASVIRTASQRQLTPHVVLASLAARAHAAPDRRVKLTPLNSYLLVVLDVRAQ